MVIIGLGSAGCNIAELFKQHKQYHVELLDEGKGIKKFETVEEYDNIKYNPRKKAIKTASKGILFVCGAGKISAASLRVLEGLKHLEMTVVYIYPDLEFCSREQKRRHKVHYGVLQEFTRSGLLKELIILDNKIMLDSVGHGTVYQYFEKVNYLIYSIIHTFNYCANVASEFGSIHEPKDISRISTIGSGSIENNEEKMYFLLDNITETCYIISINEEDLANDVTLIPNIKSMVADNKSQNRETSFAIWSTSETKSYYYTKHYTHHIQEK